MDLANGRDDAPNGGVGAEETVGRRKKVELVREAIHGFLEEKRRGGQEEEEEGLLSSLLTKQNEPGHEPASCLYFDDDLFSFDTAVRLDAVERDQDSDILEPHSLHPNDQQSGKGENSNKEVELANIAKDLNKIKRQNTITHLLLGTVIVLTAVWQVNEVSFLLWVQSKLSNPFKSLGDMIKGSLKLKGRKPVIESSPLPPVGVPDVSRADLPSLVIGSTEDR
ncbi:hypothetical protein BAE44_0025048 [Dichanthelium oligosanthes]|uniref:Uncharacterized protein n=1 Tax=Dichanthelium oligosanthes TaxID=888268 RepID=A0A1E5UM22_9POAL|nr:hypothetical protein BAE44_0025048 [Dichanthelium oligosanthes]